MHGIFRDRSKKAAEILSGRQEVNKVILFGSVARGDFNINSDIDLIVVPRTRMDPSGKAEMRRNLYGSLVGGGLMPYSQPADINLQVHNQEELEGDGGPFFTTIRRDGREYDANEGDFRSKGISKDRRGL